jgi:hypothetical protein
MLTTTTTIYHELFKKVYLYCFLKTEQRFDMEPPKDKEGLMRGLRSVLERKNGEPTFTDSDPYVRPFV